jgi:hypothetical protein
MDHLATLVAKYDVRYLCKDNRYATVSMTALTDVAHLNDPDTPFQLHVHIPGTSKPAAYIIYYINHWKREVYVDLVVNTLCGTGIGATLLKVVIAVAARFHYSVRLVAAPHYPVEGLPDRPALPLYRYYSRLGFRPSVDYDVPEFNAASVEFTMPRL